MKNYSKGIFGKLISVVLTIAVVLGSVGLATYFIVNTTPEDDTLPIGQAQTPNIPYIGANGNWYIGGVDTEICAIGSQGEQGANGLTPYIGENGNWWIGGVDQQVPVTVDGIQGSMGLSAYQLALQQGFNGTLDEWLESLRGA
ncbi:MAG: hypothetical protein LBQ05_01300, partial [Christensenellaceae bacterium]|nr:hypothetical protein [Christensenellaceae bacterium]